MRVGGFANTVKKKSVAKFVLFKNTSSGEKKYIFWREEEKGNWWMEGIGEAYRFSERRRWVHYREV